MVLVRGLKNILFKLDGIEVKHAKNIETGLVECGLLLQKKSDYLAPTDEGNLRGGSYVRKVGSGFSTKVLVGYEAEYAVVVHEDMNAAHGEEYNQKYAAQIAKGARYWYHGHMRTYHTRRPQEQAKFLEQPARESIPEFKQIIIRHAKRNK